MFRQIALHVLAVAPLIGIALGSAARAEPPQRVSGPHTHENLSIFFIHGKSLDGPVPLTLEEGLAKGFVEVHETDTVSQLLVQNKGAEDVFIQAGDIVKGGKQDRVVTASFVLPAKSKETAVPVYCVEAGRWAPRGNEDSRKFSASAEMLPTKEAKLAMLAAETGASNVGALRNRRAENGVPEQRTVNVEPQRQRANDVGSLTEQTPMGGQSEVWRNVAAIQQKLSAKLKKSVTASVSESSLQLALENTDLAAEQERYVKALQAAGETDTDIVGYAIAVNGKIASADVYASNALFRKLWPRLLKTAATEAISADVVKDAKAPDAASVSMFLAQPADAKEEVSAPVEGISRTARNADTSYDTETTRAGQFLHRSKLAR